MARDAGIESVWISDHFHPWLDDQGESPFVWSVIGAIAATTDLHVTTAVTCPTMRIHPGDHRPGRGDLVAAARRPLRRSASEPART